MAALPDLEQLRDGARVVALPLVTRFRGIDVREVLLVRGPRGWAEFSPFVEYPDPESARWLQAALDDGWGDEPTLYRDRIPVNATLPSVAPDRVEAVLTLFGSVRTVKVKVAAVDGTLAEDVARVRATRAHLGPEGRIRVDANGGWTVDEAERAAHALAPFDLEYLEQPCSTIPELVELRERLRDWQLPVAADESVRRAEDPLEVAREGAADVLVVKAAPLGGVLAALRIVAEAGLPVVVSSALDSSVGLAMGAQLAAALPELEFDCGLATAALLTADVTAEPLLPRDGFIDVRRVEPDEWLLDRYAADADRTAWWLERLDRCYALLNAAG
jgi:O-succinylbenzoate synthase